MKHNKPSIQEVRYVVQEDYTGKLGITKIEGSRCAKIVCVIPSSATQYRKQMYVGEWDKMAKTRLEAAEAHHKLMTERLVTSQRKIKQAVDANWKAFYFKDEILKEKNA